MVRLSPLTLVLVALGAASPAMAQGSPQAQFGAEAAAVLVRNGMAAYERGTREGLERAASLWTQAIRFFRIAGDPAGEAGTLNNLGAAYRRLGLPDSALSSYARALPIERAIPDRAAEAATLTNLGTLYRELGRADSALVYYSQALPIHRGLGDRAGEAATLTNIGITYHYLAQRDSALTYYTQALAVQRAAGDRAGEALTLTNIGVAQYGLGRPDSARAYYSLALHLQRAMGDRASEARSLTNIGVLFRDLGLLDSALAYFVDALPILRTLQDKIGEAGSLTDIGIVYFDLGRPDSALAYYAQALPIQRAATDRSGEAKTLNNIGITFVGVGKPDSALAYYQRALALERVAGDRSTEAMTLGNIGMGHLDLDRPDSALAYLTQGLQIVRAINEPDGIARALANIGLVYRTLGRPDSALAYYARALPIERSVGDRASEAAILTNMAVVHHRHLARLPEAVALYDSAARALASIARHSGGEQNRLSFAEKDVGLFQEWSLAWLALHQDAAALAVAERGRAQALLELMQRTAQPQGEVAAVTPPPTDLVSEGTSLARILARSHSITLSYLVTSDTLLIWVVTSTGDVRAFRTAVTEQNLATAVADLRAGIGADSASARSRLGLRDAPDLAVRSAGIGPGPQGSFVEAAARLSDWLLPAGLRKLLPAAGDVRIVPGGPLNLLPFAVLSSDSSRQPLGIRYRIRYAPSLAILAKLDRSDGGTGGGMQGTALVVGNPAMPRLHSYTGEVIILGSLPGAEAEAQWVAGEVHTNAVIGPAATEAAIKQQLASASLVHLATHGYAYSSEGRARDSFIALAPSPGEDGLLTVGEVLDGPTPLSTELVVLSACQTGLGNLKRAEGTVGLQWAFLAKGARSVLVSLWSVSDEATARLMKGFYGHWMKGSSKAEALRLAQAEVRGRPGSRFFAPRYWAAFQLVGAR